MPCPVRVFRNAERDDAVAWLTSLTTGDDVSAGDMIKSYIGGVGAAAGSVGELVIAGATKWSNRERWIRDDGDQWPSSL